MKRCPLCGAAQPDGCIPAHSNDLEFRGMGLKSSDALVAFICNSCHDIIDGRTRGTPKEEKRALWVKAFLRTMVWLWETGRIKVAK
jgi:hypothetical protein